MHDSRQLSTACSEQRVTEVLAYPWARFLLMGRCASSSSPKRENHDQQLLLPLVREAVGKLCGAACRDAASPFPDNETLATALPQNRRMRCSDRLRLPSLYRASKRADVFEDQNRFCSRDSWVGTEVFDYEVPQFR